MRTLLGALLITTIVLSARPVLALPDIHLSVGGAKVIKSAFMEKVIIGNPEVADVKLISDEELLISGKNPGSTSLIIWTKNGGKEIAAVVITDAKSATAMIQVDVQVMEIADNNGMDLGFDWEKMVGTPSQLSLKETSAPLKAIGTLERGQLDLTLRLIMERGNARILAKPKLVTLSGKPARFSSGGEIPVPIINSNNQVSVSWKSYGVKLEILPTVNHLNEVSVDIRAEVSDVDFTYLVQGNPAIKNRWASTTIHVAPRSTVVIGGLIQERTQTVNQGVPILSDIPVFGYLFKSTRYTKQTSELVIFVTPQIIGG